MSGKLMGEVFGLAITRAQRDVLQAFADHGNDDGTGVRPGVGRVAWKTGYSERQVKRIIAELKELGVLVVVEKGRGHRPTLYRICIDAGERKPPYEPPSSSSRGDVTVSPLDVTSARGQDTQMSPLDVTSESPRRDTATSPKPLEPPDNRQLPPLPPIGGNRQRDRKRYEGELEHWARQHFPDRNLKRTVGLVQNALGSGLTGVDEVRSYVEQWSAPDRTQRSLALSSVLAESRVPA